MLGERKKKRKRKRFTSQVRVSSCCSRAAHRGGQVMLLSGMQLQLRRTDHDEDDGDDVIGALVAAGLW